MCVWVFSFEKFVGSIECCSRQILRFIAIVEWRKERQVEVETLNIYQRAAVEAQIGDQTLVSCDNKVDQSIGVKVEAVADDRTRAGQGYW